MTTDATHTTLREQVARAIRGYVGEAVEVTPDEVVEAAADAVLVVFAERERLLRATVTEAMKFQPCHELCSHLWCDRGIDEQSLDDLIRTIAERGYLNAELMKKDGAAERERLLRERIEALPRAAGAEAVDDQLSYVALTDVLAVFSE